MSLSLPEVNIIFAGCGSFFAGTDQYQTNLVIEAKYPSGTVKRLLFDCGTDAKFSLPEVGLKPGDIDAVYVTHQHGDHSGGLEWLAFGTYFGGKEKPKLICEENLMEDLWEHGLKGAMTTIPGKTATLSEYFKCCAVPQEGGFYWANIYFALHQTVHVCSGMSIKHCYGVLMSPAISERNTVLVKRNAGFDDIVIYDSGERANVKLWDDKDLPCARYGDSSAPRVLITGDTRFDPNIFGPAYNAAGLIVHDCETAPYKSGVHPSYDDLKTLPQYIKTKMLLCHYQPTDKDPTKDGFMGFAKKGQKVRIW